MLRTFYEVLVVVRSITQALFYAIHGGLFCDGSRCEGIPRLFHKVADGKTSHVAKWREKSDDKRNKASSIYYHTCY